MTGIVYANSAPALVKSFDDLIMKEGIALTLNLSEYFEDPDGDNITYTITSSEGISITLTNDEIYIVPDDGFVGMTDMKIKASDSNVTKSNEVLVYILEANPTKVDTSINETNSTDENSTDENETKTNTPPEITQNQKSILNSSKGEEITLSVTSIDTDGDTLTHVWKLNGEIISGDTNELKLNDLEVGEHKITLETSDGTETISKTWEVTIIKEPRAWMAWLSIAMSIIIFLGAIYYLIQMRKNRIPETETPTGPTAAQKYVKKFQK